MPFSPENKFKTHVETTEEIAEEGKKSLNQFHRKRLYEELQEAEKRGDHIKARAIDKKLRNIPSL